MAGTDEKTPQRRLRVCEYCPWLRLIPSLGRGLTYTLMERRSAWLAFRRTQWNRKMIRTTDADQIFGLTFLRQFDSQRNLEQAELLLAAEIRRTCDAAAP